MSAASKRKAIAWLPAAVWMGVIFYLSSLTGDKIHLPAFPYSDKVAHFFAYSFLGWLISLRRVLGGSTEPDPAGLPLPVRIDAMGSAIGWLYGASDEFHQRFVPLRESSIYDWNADALGILAGSWACRKMFRKVWNRDLDPAPDVKISAS